MARKGGGRSGGISRSSGGLSRAPASRLPARAAPTPPAPVQAAAPKQPGMFSQMAQIAGGVAVGHAVGNAIGNVVGGVFSSSEPQVQQQQPVYQQQTSSQQQPADNPCAFQMKQFLDCAQNQYDVSLCQGFNEALKECRISYGLPR